MLRNNLNFLRNNRIDIYNKLAELEQQAQRERLQIQRVDGPMVNVMLLAHPQPFFIHHPSDPEAEASQVIRTAASQFSDNEHSVLFFGVGLGYHIKKFAEEYPHVPYSIYEPSAKMLIAFLSEISLDQINIGMLRHVFFGFDQVKTAAGIQAFIDQTPKDFTLITLPSYKLAFGQLTEEFIKVTQRIIDRKTKLRHINIHFEKKWVRNSFDNFSYTLRSPSIFDYREHLQHKPVLLVAAGPSLQDEIETIREIKENGSAYIFAVGSAINTLVEYRIVPDAAFTYDPGDFNRHVFDRAIQENTVPFPLVYGTTVGQGTLESFPWPIVHVPISQDKVFEFYVRSEREAIVVQDAPSVAVITLQVLMELKCSPIILVGQNLAFREGQYYSKGVPHGFNDNNDRIPVPNVFGETVLTNYSLNMMRKEMEHYLRNNAAATVINTTKDGARIEGAPFQTLAETMSQLNSRGVVVPDWYSRPLMNDKDVSFLVNRRRQMSEHYDQAKQLFHALNTSMQVIRSEQVPNHFYRFDELFRELQKNFFFRYFLQPMNRVGHEVLFSKVVTVKVESDLRRKSELVLKLYGPFLQQCYDDFEAITPLYEELNGTIERYVNSRHGVERV